MTSRALHRFTLLLIFATLVLVVAGGLVTSHGVGMAVPDWPNTYGYNMFFFPISKWVGGIFYEHTHRLIASVVGLLTMILAVWLYGRKSRPLLRWGGAALLVVGFALGVGFSSRRADGLVLVLTGGASLGASLVWPRRKPAPRWLRRLGLAALLAVVLQGVLGGLRVVLFKDQIGILHAALAQLFFVLVCALGLFTSKGWAERNASLEAMTNQAMPHVSLRWWFYAGTIIIFAQLLLGAAMRHEHAGLAIPDFPLAYGKLWPALDPQSVASYNSRRIEVMAANPITASQVVLQMVHRIVAVAILVVVAAAAVKAARRRGATRFITRLSFAWAMMILVQVCLGAATIWSNKAADIATSHMFVGALSLAVGAILSIITYHDATVMRPRPAAETGYSASPRILPGSAPAGSS